MLDVAAYLNIVRPQSDLSPLDDTNIYHSNKTLVYSANILPNLSNKSSPNAYQVFQVNIGVKNYQIQSSLR